MNHRQLYQNQDAPEETLDTPVLRDVKKNIDILKNNLINALM